MRSARFHPSFASLSLYVTSMARTAGRYQGGDQVEEEYAYSAHQWNKSILLGGFPSICLADMNENTEEDW